MTDLIESVPLRLMVPSHGNAESMHALFLHHGYITGEFPVHEFLYGRGVYKTGPNFRGMKRIRESFYEGSYSCLMEGTGFVAAFESSFSNRQWTTSIYAKNRAVAHRAARKFRTLTSEEEIAPDHVQATFWHYSDGAKNSVRQLFAPNWADISQNYPSRTRGSLDRLVNIGPEDVNGKIVLLHGPPGTGKTTFLVTLGKAWAKWCSTDIVIDPEMLFNVPDYMITAFLNKSASFWEDDEEGQPDEKWRMIVLEDTDELISSDAHAKSGQAMSRLLNLTDGMLGKGSNLIIALTTNEDMSKLHPAITRPGRCLMNINVPEFDAREARAWLGDGTSVTEGKTLAEMYELKNGADNNTAPDSASPGQYI